MVLLRKELFLLGGVLFFVFVLGVVSADCVDECAVLFSTQCYADSTGYSICVDVDMDGCLEWKDEFVCSAGMACLNGSCVNSSSVAAGVPTGIVPSGSPSSSGGGGGVNECVTTWNCSGWGVCSRGSQERVCSKVRLECRTSVSKPAEMRACSSSDGGGDAGDDDDLNVGGDAGDEEAGGGMFFWIGGIIVLFVIIGGGIWFLLRRKKDDEGVVESVSDIDDSAAVEINQLLDKGEMFLREGNVAEAKKTYNIIKGKFSGVGPGSEELFARVKDFYDRVVMGG